MADKTQEQVAEEKAAKEAADKKAAANKKGLAGLIIEACEAFGVVLEYLFASSIKDGVATILTNGGKRVRYRKGDKVERLDDIAITGINPKLKKRKVIAGKAKK